MAIKVNATTVIDNSRNASLVGINASGQIVSTDPYDAASGGGNIYLNSTTGNRIDFNINGLAAPAFTTRSVGTKIVLWPGIGASSVDFAVGLETDAMWFSVPNAANGIYKWYGGTTLGMQLNNGRLGINTEANSYDLIALDGNHTAANSIERGVTCRFRTSTAATSTVSGFVTLGLAGAAGTYNTGIIQHFAAGNYTLGTNQTATNQYGFYCSALSGATNNYAFFANSSAGWNFYANNTAPNYFAGDVTVGNGTADSRIIIKKADNDVSDQIQFYSGTTRVGEIGCHDTTYLRINQVTDKTVYTPRWLYVESRFSVGGLDPATGPIATCSLKSGGSGYGTGIYTNQVLSGGGVYATFDITVELSGVVTGITLKSGGSGFSPLDEITIPALGGSGSGGVITVNSVTSAGANIYSSAPRLRLANNDTSLDANQEIGSIFFNTRDASANGAGDLVKLIAKAESTSAGGRLEVWTTSSGGASSICATFGGNNDFRLYNSASTYYHTFINNPTANRTLTLPDWTGTVDVFPFGTVMLFVQSAAPTGWTKITTHNNKALRVVSGTVSTGGTVAFTTAFASKSVSGTVGSTTLTINQIPSHNHTYSFPGSSIIYVSSGPTGLDLGNAYTYTSGNAGGGQGHTHTFTGTAIDLAVQYVDVIIATKN